MGLDDLVGGEDDDDTNNENQNEKATGEERYFNTTAKKTRGPIDRIKDEIEVRGEDRGNHTLYVLITKSIKMKDGVLYNDKDERIVDLTGEYYRINTKELRMMYGDKSQQVICYEIKVR